jgi:hypothetical protein
MTSKGISWKIHFSAHGVWGISAYVIWEEKMIRGKKKEENVKGRKIDVKQVPVPNLANAKGVKIRPKRVCEE